MQPNIFDLKVPDSPVATKPKVQAEKVPMRLADWEAHCAGPNKALYPKGFHGVIYVDRYDGSETVIYPVAKRSIVHGYPGAHDRAGGNKNEFLPWAKQQVLWAKEVGRRKAAIERGQGNRYDEIWLAHCQAKADEIDLAIQSRLPDPEPPFEYIYIRLRMRFPKEA